MNLPWDNPDHDVLGDIQAMIKREGELPYNPRYCQYCRGDMDTPWQAGGGHAQECPGDEPLVNVTEYNKGFTAGWRNDELIGEKSYSFTAGYEAGQTAKETVG